MSILQGLNFLFVYPLHIEDICLVILDKLFNLNLPVTYIFLMLTFHLLHILLFLCQLLLEFVGRQDVVLD